MTDASVRFSSLPDIGASPRNGSALLEKIFNSTHILVAYLDPQFNFIRVNRRYAQADGHDPGFFTGKNHFALYPNPENETIFRRVVETGQPYFAYEKVFTYEEHPERGQTYWDWSLEPIFGADGKVEALLLTMIDVTNRKRSEVGLEEAQRLAHIGSWEWNLARGSVSWSEEMRRIYGLDRSYSPNFQTTIDVAHPDDRARVKAYFDQLPEGGARTVEHRIVRPDGSVRIVRREAEILRDRQGRVARLTGTCQDITEMKQAEEKLRASEERFRTMAETIEEVFWMSTPGIGQILYISPAYAKLWGRAEEELYRSPRSFLEAVHPEDRPKLEAAYAERHARGIPYELEYRIVRPDGAVRWMREMGFPVRDEQGRVRAMTGSVSDITERRLAWENVRKSEKNLAEAQRIANLGNWDWDILRDTLAWSDEIYRIFGLDPQEFAATYEAFLDAVHPDDRQKVVEGVNAALRSERRYSIDHRIIRRDGSVRYVHEDAEVTFSENGNPVRMLGTVQDITDRKLDEIALSKLNRALRTLSQGNQALVHAGNEEALLRDMCRVIAEQGGYRAAWVGYAEHDPLRTVRPVAQVGFPETDFARLAIRFDETERHPTGAAIRSGHAQIVRDALADPGLAAWRSEATRHGYKSLVAVPLRSDGQILGAMTIYAAERNAFDDEEVRLLSELADDLSYGIGTLRTREDRTKAIEQLHKSMEGTIQAVASTVEMRDPYTAGHQRRVAQLGAAIGREMGLSDGEITAIRMAGNVHDIGKVYVPAEILNRPGGLSPVEMTLVKMHTQVGHDILKNVEFPWPVAEMLRQHHERMDGSGYPRGLKGEEILRGARIIAVADVVEAMASHRPYRPARGVDMALDEIAANRGAKYDPQAVDACLALFRENRFSFAPGTGWW